MLTLGLVCAKKSAGAGYAIRRRRLRRRLGRVWRSEEVGGGWFRAEQPPLPSPTLHNLLNLLHSLNGTGANVMTKRTNAAHASLRRDAGSGRCASRTGGGPRPPPAQKYHTNPPASTPPPQEARAHE